MKTLITIACLVSILFLVACGEDNQLAGETPVRIAFVAPFAMLAEEPYTLIVTVTGEGMEEMKSETTFSGKQARIEFPAIPSGSDRVFTVEVRDKNGNIWYGGQTTENLIPNEPMTVAISVIPMTGPVAAEVTYSEIQVGIPYTLTVKVMGDGMETMVKNTDFTGKPEVVKFHTIPSGQYRKFVAEIRKNGVIIAIGAITQPLIPGTPITVSIPVESIPIVEMVRIPAGEFEMGDPFNEVGDARPVHIVYLDEFYIDKYEVTNAQYRLFVQSTGHHEPEMPDLGWTGSGFREKIYKPWQDSAANAPDQPVVAVSWYDAAAYTQWAGKRLPTEAEWEKAARGGLVGKRYPWGDAITHDNANYEDRDGRDQWWSTSPVGSFPPNGYGLYDMAGNVWEWCMDEYDEGFYAKSPKNNPVAGGFINFVNNDFINVKSSRVLRGGSCYSDGFVLAVSVRGRADPSHNILRPVYAGGFRCARTLPP
ncbi:TPA: formylglycine-generating enzyme family protein [Candidatus Poribacteria bacterium]|nr:formylglycine-generating enzyme family protein [Candidatus Poribacteria bacterium]